MSIVVAALALGPMGNNTYLAADPDAGQAVVIDPSFDGAAILDEATRRGWTLEQIWLTHAHFDHISAGGSVARAFTPPLPAALHPLDLPLWRRKGEAAQFGLPLDPGPEPAILLEDGQILPLGKETFQVIHVPGHTAGSVLFHHAESQTAFCGDAIFRGGIGRTDLPGGDFDTLIASLRQRVLTLPDATRLLCGHGPATTVGRERTSNPFLAFDP